MTTSPPARLATLLLLAAASACTTAPRTGGAVAAGDAPRTVMVDTIPLWFRAAGRAGDAPPLVFLHGGPGQGSEHLEVLAGRRLEERLRIVYLDQRGSGRSGKGDPSLYTVEKMVDDVDSVRKALGAPRLALMGHSFGGVLALEYAARHPERVASVVFVSGLWDLAYQGPLRCTHMNRVARPLMVQAMGEAMADSLTRAGDCSWAGRLPAPVRDSLSTAIMFPRPQVNAQLDSIERATGRRNTGQVGSALFRSGLGEYRFTRFDRLTMPVLVVAGRHDGAAVPEGLRTLAGRLPNARFVEFADAGHFVYLDEPARFADEVTTFVRRHR